MKSTQSYLQIPYLNHDLKRLTVCYNYSFKIFLRFWLAKRTRIIHHNQLLLTKFGRTLRLINRGRRSAAQLQVNAPLTEKTWGRGRVVLVVKRKMAEQLAEHFTRFMTNYCLKHSKKTTRRTTSAIWSIFADLNSPSSSKHALSR